MPEIIRFGIIGVVNTVVYYVAYRVALIWAHYLVAQIIAVGFGFTAALLLHTRFTFRSELSFKAGLRFVAANAATYLLFTLFVFIGISAIGIRQTWAPIVVAPIVVPVSFLLNRLALVNRATYKS